MYPLLLGTNEHFEPETINFLNETLNMTWTHLDVAKCIHQTCYRQMPRDVTPKVRCLRECSPPKKKGLISVEFDEKMYVVIYRAEHQNVYMCVMSV